MGECADHSPTDESVPRPSGNAQPIHDIICGAVRYTSAYTYPYSCHAATIPALVDAVCGATGRVVGQLVGAVK